jgi:hypothetical protein
VRGRASERASERERESTLAEERCLRVPRAEKTRERERGIDRNMFRQKGRRKRYRLR